MSDDRFRQSQRALKKARLALDKGNRMEARRLVLSVLELAPEHESGWLMMAELATDHAKIGYLIKALEINPQNQQARDAIHEHLKNQRQKKNTPSQNGQEISTSHSLKQPSSKYEQVFDQKTNTGESFVLHPLIKTAIRAGGLIIPVLFLGLAFFIWSAFTNDWIVLAGFSDNGQSARALLQPELIPSQTSAAAITTHSSPAPTATQSPTISPTPFPSPTQTKTSSPSSTHANVEAQSSVTPAVSATLSPTHEPLPEETDQVKNVLLLTQTIDEAQKKVISIPSGIAPDERWIDINLSTQQLLAYTGNENIRTFTVSTGTSYTPTPTGIFHIYVKYPAADMYGPGYYLPGVPSVMYFNKDYGIHGAYWHMNFGTPMSHGCVNMKLEDAAWLFEWSSVGTTVNIHH